MLKQPKLLVLGGPTAVGKTALAIQWAQTFNGEIINADSRQIYRHMDIGTAKPTAAERAAAPHHLLDVVNPDQTLTLADVQARIMAAIDDIAGRGKLPILAGGTGMYLTATLEGWQIPEVPPNPALRTELERLSNAELLDKLKTLDPVTAERIDANNPRRLVRAVEVCLETGEPFSQLRKKNPPPLDALHFVLDMEREALYERADQRVEMMIAAGWVDEVRRLGEMGYTGDIPARTALGYPQIMTHLAGKMSLTDAIERIQRDTHKFIRRQYTWLRGHDPGWVWLSDGEKSLPQIETWLAQA